MKIQPRMKNPAMLLPDAAQALMTLGGAIKNSPIPSTMLELVYLRVSQINGCGVCVDMHGRSLRAAGETDERMMSVSAWQDAPYFTDAERAALALAEATTRISDRSDPVPDSIWDEAARLFDEKALASLVLNIAMINFWNRINVPTRQIAGEWIKSAEAAKYRAEAQRAKQQLEPAGAH
jgi:AhpD family alkylhydroperoxidase